eukprot:TRINITY_DN14003_c0_g1_i3.p1 TRINITY_DN14003_c0_g1~~TRINITY_DN14003_c0_g1_i3.p1  ORF type:complete len:443 (-),score=47.36 TRINITY_DN14003_c0_g1_i3:191-1492(-)
MKVPYSLKCHPRHEWLGNHLHLDLFQATLKLSPDEGVPAFGRLLSPELVNVHAVMVKQSKYVLASTKVIRVCQPSLKHWETVVIFFQMLCEFASSYQSAVYQILSEFERHFQVSFWKAGGLPVISDQLPDADDIHTWLLIPAQNCLQLRRCSIRDPRVNSSARQLNFWVEELRTGMQHFHSVIFGKPPASALDVRLSMWSRAIGEDYFRGDIHNTFIEFKARHNNALPRSQSSPHISDPRGLCVPSTSPAALEQNAAPHCREDKPKAAVAKDSKRSKCGPPVSSPRWWTRRPVTETCPICGFPICLLPYPPFFLSGLQVGQPHQQQPGTLVDRKFMVLKVMSTWDFQVLGTQLSSEAIVALDQHLKRCRLGVFRLGGALELMRIGTPEARRDLRELRNEATRQLRILQSTQKNRLKGAAGLNATEAGLSLLQG